MRPHWPGSLEIWFILPDNEKASVGQIVKPGSESVQDILLPQFCQETLFNDVWPPLEEFRPVVSRLSIALGPSK